MMVPFFSFHDSYVPVGILWPKDHAAKKDFSLRLIISKYQSHTSIMHFHHELARDSVRPAINRLSNIVSFFFVASLSSSPTSTDNN